MSAIDRDGYEAYYAQKLWALLPEVYRAEDSAGLVRSGPLRELLNRIGAEAAVVRRSMDRLWENQSIEACDDWVIAYIADLLATNLVASLDARGQRLDVAKTIYYRRRKGTLGVLEELASDITGWPARVVEMFRRLGRNRHLLDPAFGWPADTTDPKGALEFLIAAGLVGEHTKTPMGGFADLRNTAAAGRAGSAFDELHYTADVRIGRGKTGLYNIMKLGVFLWRKKSFEIDGMTAVQGSACKNVFTFDPTGRSVPLYAADMTLPEGAFAAEHQMPGPLTQRIVSSAFGEVYAIPDPADPTDHMLQSVGVFRKNVTTFNLVPGSVVTADPREMPSKQVFLDPERGRIYLQLADTNAELRAGCHFGFSAAIGAYGYDRRLRGAKLMEPTPVQTLTGGGIALATALGGLGAPANATVIVDDSLTYTQLQDLVAILNLRVSAGQKKRPAVRTKNKWILTGARPESELVLDGVLFSGGGELVLEGTWRHVVIDACTLDPGSWDAANVTYEKAIDGRDLAPFRIVVTGRVEHLEIRRSIVGPIATSGKGIVTLFTAEDSILQGVGNEKALHLDLGRAELRRITVLGDAVVHQVFASSSLLLGKFDVADDQNGCVRFSAWTSGSTLPRKFESAEVGFGERIVASEKYGDPDYAAVSLATRVTILEGAEDGSEMGAFSIEKNPIKERSLLVKYKEYMPLGLTPVLVYVT